MKKRTLFAFVLICALAMAGCGKGQAGRHSILGSWEAKTEMSILGVSVADEEGPQSAEVLYRFDFFADGTGDSSIVPDGKYADRIPGTNAGFTYTLDGDKLTLTYENGNTEIFTVSFRDGKLILDGRAHLELVPKIQ